MTRIELDYSRNYPEAVNAPQIEQYFMNIHGFLKTKFAGVAVLDIARDTRRSAISFSTMYDAWPGVRLGVFGIRSFLFEQYDHDVFVTVMGIVASTEPFEFLARMTTWYVVSWSTSGRSPTITLPDTLRKAGSTTSSVW